jgi:hypothetical protein
MYNDEYDLEAELENYRDGLEKEANDFETDVSEGVEDFENNEQNQVLIEYTIPEKINVLLYSNNNNEHYFSIPDTIKYIKNISLEIEIEDNQICIDDKNHILNSRIDFTHSNKDNIRACLITLLMHQICRNNNIIEHENRLIIPIYDFDDCLINENGKIKILINKLFKLKLSILIKTKNRQSNNKYQPIFMNNANFGGNNEYFFGKMFYINDNNQPVIYRIIVKNTNCSIEYTNKDILIVEIWGIYLYIISFNKQYRTAEKIMNCFKKPIQYIIKKNHIKYEEFIYGFKFISLDDINYINFCNHSISFTKILQ